jgi:hypothetical protein
MQPPEVPITKRGACVDRNVVARIDLVDLVAALGRDTPPCLGVPRHADALPLDTGVCGFSPVLFKRLKHFPELRTYE